MPTTLSSIIRTANVRLFEQGDLDSLDEFFATDYVAHLTDRDLDGGHEAIRRVMQALAGAFTDLRVEVDILVEGEDRVAWQRTLRGTHRGAFRGFPATGRGIAWRDMHTSRFRDGRICEEWVVSDLAEQLLAARKR